MRSDKKFKNFFGSGEQIAGTQWRVLFARFPRQLANLPFESAHILPDRTVRPSIRPPFRKEEKLAEVSILPAIEKAGPPGLQRETE